jgi:cephalosporin hydroxylase
VERKLKEDRDGMNKQAVQSYELDGTDPRFLDYAKFVNEVYYDWPIISSALKLDYQTLPWQMEYYERACLTFVLQNFKPSVAIEVGTASGGSLAVLARFSKKVFSFDIDRASSEYLKGRWSNVEYIVGDSKLLLPPILERVQREQSESTFVFIDGDHSQAGVRTDLNNVLKFIPRFPMVIMAHDSFNPGCRAGMLEVQWAQNPYVHSVEIDFQHGSIFDRSTPPGQMWGGLALAVLLPTKRQGSLTVSKRHQLLFKIVAARSFQSSIEHRVRRGLNKVWRRVSSRLRQ